MTPAKRLSTSEYWIGDGIDYGAVWDAYESGQGYVQKYHSMEVHLLRIRLKEQSGDLPLFNFEAVFKTLKGYFHDLKKKCLTPHEYLEAGPLFIYQVNRSSGVWDFLGELRQLLMFGTSLANEKLMGEKLENMKRRVEFLKSHFGNAVREEDFERFMKARTPAQLERALNMVFAQNIQSVEVSPKPFAGDIKEVTSELVDLKQLSKRLQDEVS